MSKQPVDYRRVAAESFAAAQAEAADARALLGRAPVWEELTARFAAATAQFAEAAAAATMAMLAVDAQGGPQPAGGAR